ncbi:hypothetical protein H4582DRAFT_2056563 [Lactarius indigo]|nr:hypothetical protein H4582DRAFT_2056563 [Lactarius indigo]
MTVFGQIGAQWLPLFQAPWPETSLGDFWGVWWHQIFKRSFAICGAKPAVRLLGCILEVVWRENRFRGARVIRLVVGYGQDVLLGELDCRCIVAKRAYRDTCGQRTPGSILGKGHTEIDCGVKSYQSFVFLLDGCCSAVAAMTSVGGAAGVLNVKGVERF